MYGQVAQPPAVEQPSPPATPGTSGSSASPVASTAPSATGNTISTVTCGCAQQPADRVHDRGDHAGLGAEHELQVRRLGPAGGLHLRG
jgi:hypothetical protein